MKRTARTTLLKPSTREFIKEARRTRGYSFFDWLHGYIYARWPYFYISVGTGEHRLTKIFGGIGSRLIQLFSFEKTNGKKSAGEKFADTYHGKVVPLNAAKQLVMIEEEISLKDLEQVVPYEKARDIILKNPDHIVLLDCPCRMARPNPCLPLDVCLIIGEPMAGFVAEHHPGHSRWITQEEAARILEEEHQRGHVHHAFFKDAMLGRFYAICNCCACCCGAMQAMRNGTPMIASSGYMCRADEEKCIGCGECIDVCQFKALSLNDGKIAIDEAMCYGCGVCTSTCSQQALTLIRESRKGEPLEIKELIKNYETNGVLNESK